VDDEEDCHDRLWYTTPRIESMIFFTLLFAGDKRCEAKKETCPKFEVVVIWQLSQRHTAQTQVCNSVVADATGLCYHCTPFDGFEDKSPDEKIV
jgi:hypothetical protein